jgi:anti-sigma factor RsiW
MPKSAPGMPGAFFAYLEGCVADGALDLNALLSATEAAAYAGVTVNVIVNWRNRGLLPVAADEQGREIRDKQGRPRYRLLAVAKAENLARERGERMAKRITRRDPEQRLAA